MVRPERFELPAFWFVARRSIQLSYGRILILTAFQQLTAEGAWSSTANSLEALAFHAKDALLVIDDFAPQGSGTDVQGQKRE